MQDKPRPLVGIGVMVFKNGKVLIGKRKGSHGENEYAWPGGHLEHAESIIDCATREVKEETGIEIQNIRFQFVANVLKYLPKHYLHIGLIADWEKGVPHVLEPEKVEEWIWCDLDSLPEALFEMCKLQVKSLKTGQIFFDSKS